MDGQTKKIKLGTPLMILVGDANSLFRKILFHLTELKLDYYQLLFLNIEVGGTATYLEYSKYFQEERLAVLPGLVRSVKNNYVFISVPVLIPVPAVQPNRKSSSQVRWIFRTFQLSLLEFRIFFFAK